MTEKQRKFAIEYIKDLNGTKAYMVAYPNITNGKTAAAAASRLLTNVKVQTFIEEKLSELEQEGIADAEEVLKFYSTVVRAESIKANTTERLKAADSLGRYHNLFTENIALTGALPVVIVDDIGEDDG